MNRPLVIAHRGGAALAPENTLSAFRRALDAGVDGIELDLQLTDGNDLVVIHDRLDPGEARPDAPPLAAVLDLVAARNAEATIVVDIKASPWRSDRHDEGQRLIDIAAPLFAAYPRPEKLVLASFDWSALEHVSEHSPDWITAFHTIAPHWLTGLSSKQTGLSDMREFLAHLEGWRQTRGPGHEALSPLDMMRGAGARIWSCQHRDLTASAIARSRELDLQVWTWTVNTVDDLERVLALGVDAVTTDWPDHVLHYLDHGQWSA